MHNFIQAPKDYDEELLILQSAIWKTLHTLSFAHPLIEDLSRVPQKQLLKRSSASHNLSETEKCIPTSLVRNPCLFPFAHSNSCCSVFEGLHLTVRIPPYTKLQNPQMFPFFFTLTQVFPDTLLLGLNITSLAVFHIQERYLSHTIKKECFE